MNRTLLRLLLASILISPPADAGTAAPRPWSVDDLVRAEGIAEWDTAPDGASVVWVRTSVEEVEGTETVVSNLWRSRLGGGDPVALTRGTDRVAAPSFSPDGRFVAFISSRKPPGEADEDRGKQQLWLLPTDGGEAYPLTSFDRSIDSFSWQDAENLIVLAPESRSAWELERKERKDSAVVVDDVEHEPPGRLFRVSVSGEARRLTRNRDWISSLSVAPDGRRAVVVAAQDLKYQFDQKNPPHTYLVDLSTGSLERLFEEGGQLPSQVRWAPDSSGFYFTDDFTRHPRYRMATISELYFHDLAGGRSAKVELDWPRGLGPVYQPFAGGVLALLEDGVRFRPALLRRSGSGWRRQDLTGRHAAHLEDLRLSRDGRLVTYLHSSATTPPQLFAARLEDARLVEDQRLSDLNEGFADKPAGRVEAIRWTGAGGDEVEGLLHFPLDWPLDRPLDQPLQGHGAEAGPRPLVVNIHGGPASADRDRWDQRWAEPLLLLRQRGAFVLQVNYHGSAGYGLDWVESIAERYYEQERVDIETGVDHLIALGLVDPERLGCMGWSNGGILTAELITRTERFKAASVGAADVEWISDWANVDFGAAFDNYYFGGPPWERLQEYIERSPFFRLSEVTTPTIVFTGTEDRNVPPHQSWSLYRALQYLEKAPARLVLFPGEPHGLRQVAHQRRKVEEELAWFDRHLFGSPDDTPEAIRDGSLLAGLVARARAARFGAALGMERDGKLVPETVSFAGLEVGRFEVTRSQFAAFDPGYEVAGGDEDLPATGVSFERARAYAAWLANLTARPFRLPTREEAEKLADRAGGGGNTLDRWAGYRANPEDAERIRGILRQLPGGGSLLLTAGSLAGSGDEPVFDLDGNAAEWAVGEGGEGVVIGRSADRPADPRSPSATDDPAYVGFRVVVGEG